MPSSKQIAHALADLGHKDLAKKLSTVLAFDPLEEQLSGILQEPIWKGAMLNAKEGMKVAAKRLKTNDWGSSYDQEAFVERLQIQVEDDMAVVRAQAKVLENYATQGNFGDPRTLTALKALMLRLNGCFHSFGAMQVLLRARPQTAAVEHES